MRRLRQAIVTIWMRQPIGLSGVLLTTLSLTAYRFAPEVGMALLVLLLIGALLHIFVSDLVLARVARDMGAEKAFPLIRAVQKRGLQLAEANRSVSQRLAQRHGLSGLPTRELLIIAMNAEEGVLGIIEFVDFDRLTATDPDRADQALSEIARRIVRMAGSQRMVAHVDRARFAIWFDGASEEEASGALQAIAYALQDRMTIDGEELLPIIRMGHIQFDPETSAADRLLSRAFAILANQHKGVAGSLENASTSIRGDFELEQDLRRAIAAGEFELWFQPFIDSRRQVVCGAEALIRWHHPVRGFVSPAQFIPVVESSGLSEDVGVWVLDSACRAARSWSATGLPEVKVAVNVSGHQLERPYLGQSVARTLARHNLRPGLLELELTETVAAIDSRAAADLLASLRALGVSISIDDFGTGFSSLSYLKNLSFDKLKIDREFVTDIDTRRDSQAICQSIIALGRGLGIAVLAEGVERPEEMAWLRDHGCHLYQGFYFSRPLPEAEFVAFARDREIIGRLLTVPISDMMKRKSA